MIHIRGIKSGHQSSAGRAVKKTRTVAQEANTTRIARCELDTRADTICAGANCRPIYFTRQQCEVKGFSEEFEPIQDVRVASVATAWCDGMGGPTYILIFNEALYFGGEMGHSLINPNQIRHHGVRVHDNPYEMDPTRAMGIELYEDLRLPFQSEGSTVYFESKYPSDQEMEECIHVVLTSDNEWNPHEVNMRAFSEHHRLIEQVSSDQVSERNRDHLIYESDCHLFNTDGNTEQLLFERMVSSVIVSPDDIRSAREVLSNTRHSTFTTEHISKIFNVGTHKAKEILFTTTQKGVRLAVRPLNRRYRIDHLNLHHNDLGGNWTLDHMESKVRSLRGHTGSFVFSNGNLVTTYPTNSKSGAAAAEGLRRFCSEIGIPMRLKSDMAASFTGQHTDFLNLIRKYNINLTYSEPHRHNQLQQVDVAIRDVKRRWRHKMIQKNIPRRLWCYGIEHQAKLMQFIPRGHNERTGYEQITGHTPDISEFCDFDFYDLVWYWRTPHPSLTEHDRELAWWVGVANNVGSDLCYWLVPVSGIPIATTTVQHVTAEDMRDADLVQRVDRFNQQLSQRLDETNFMIEDTGYPADVYIDYDDTADITVDPDVDNERPEADTIDSYDKWIGATFLLDPTRNLDNVGTKAQVVQRRTDPFGNPIGRAHANPLMDTREYEVILEDGTYDTYCANTIAENIWSQCDSEGREVQIFKEIVDHKTDDRAIKIANGFDIVNGHRKPKKTTVGWKIMVEFVDGSTVWLPLKDVKDSNPVELAEYAVLNNIHEEPAFKWWAHHVLPRRDRIIKKLKSKYWRTTHKFGIRIPKTIEEAIRLDLENGDTQWMDAVRKEMSKAGVAYIPIDGATPQQVRSNKCDALRGHQEIRCHIIFDVKMDFTRKARFVAGGHMTETPSSLTYSSVVSRESVKIAFLVAALNDIDIMSCDIGNAYLNAPCREKIWFLAGAECGSCAGMVCKLVRALYGLKSSGAAWRAMFSTFIKESLKFTPTRIDPDVYYRRNIKPNGDPYYEYLLVYVDDVLVVSYAPEEVMKGIGKEFQIKNDEYGPPTIYLGAGISKYTLSNGKECWSMDSKQYVKAAVDTVQKLLEGDGRELKTSKRTGGTHGALPTNYQPELDSTPKCDEEHASRYRQIIGILRWAIELGRFDILLEVSLLSQYQANPRVGHLEALYLIVSYLHNNQCKRVLFDPNIPYIAPDTFRCDDDWTEFYGDVKEEDPPGMPEPLGASVTIGCFVDADHAGNKVTRRSHTGIIMFLNKAPVQVFSKRQNTCESSTYGSELVAMRIARDMISAMRIKLKCFGIPINGPANVHCDNNGVVLNMSIPESTLNKKHNAVNYHVIRESVAAGMLRIGKEDTATNIADVFTKLLPYSRKYQLLRGILLDR
jgi:hypothetical protein